MSASGQGKRRRWLLALVALLAHGLGALSYRWHWLASFGPRRQIEEALDVPLALAILVATATIAGGATVAAAYLWLREGRWPWAPLGVAALGTPSLVLAMIYGWAAAIFMGWV